MENFLNSFFSQRVVHGYRPLFDCEQCLGGKVWILFYFLKQIRFYFYLLTDVKQKRQNCLKKETIL